MKSKRYPNLDKEILKVIVRNIAKGLQSITVLIIFSCLEITEDLCAAAKEEKTSLTSLFWISAVK